jgi:uncharacterized UPF0146 family protein
MGDSKRFHVVSQFVARNFRPCKVLDVAGGSGELNIALSALGFDVTTVDVVKGKGKRIRGIFQLDQVVDFDLVVGLHPDGATNNLILNSQNKATVLVPCCNHNFPLQGDIIPIVRRKMLYDFETVLEMSGKNTVFVKL